MKRVFTYIMIISDKYLDNSSGFLNASYKYVCELEESNYVVCHIRVTRGNEKHSRKNYINISLISCRIIFSEISPYEYLILLFERVQRVAKIFVRSRLLNWYD